MTTEDAREMIIGDGPVLLTYGEGIANIQLNRPESANGFNIDLMKALQEAIMTVHGDKRVRAVILSGNGKIFCAGGDVKEFLSKGEELPNFLRMATAYLQICVSGLVNLEAPVIAKVQGFATGGAGLGLIGIADLVICGDSAKFMAGGTRVGMAPDAGATATLTKMVGFRRAMDLVLTNRFVEAQEAERIGLVTRTVPDEDLDAEVWKMARMIAAGAPRAQAATKRLMWNGMGRGFEASLPDEAREVSALSGTKDSLEGLQAVIERRAPVFTGE
ncbi:enoyl-CoA hydratase/isomerase family protein [Thalassovita taeanensis]|uniref:2-(1,2-epoxy-1,2-dihydrophenyl)acetyl-CoA isomerase n=1 Tax=Thalassovita taeanensis TaxID=657014 RepID=A0A1H9HA61_9RHOB|nr:enoyl-CoA hydratase-related protein [Thalassovita taeanensis]SEQ59220.1 2-(1,2-epoxy-1,2-dihydrophenyl)acetyl-CoA isomerase [Thalassovita taeanensis]